jgi:hypothetical protein
MHASTPSIHAGLSRFLLGLAGAFGLLLSMTPASAQPQDGYIGPELSSEPAGQGREKGGRYGGGYYGEWGFCAGEGERCGVRGWGVVRYGTDGRYYFREVRNATLRCDNSMFGDPYRGKSKQCEVRYYSDGGWGDGGGYGDDYGDDYGWTRCASEGRLCRVGGRATVRYGADGRFYEREVRGEVLCSNQAFGDPAPGRSKYCEVRGGGDFGGGGGSGWGGGGSSGDWQYCASEDGFCNLPGRGTVRFGTDGRFTERSYRGGSVSCSVREFGDPARGKKKHCEFRLDGGGSGAGWGGGIGGGIAESSFEYCANEDGYCDFRGRRLVRFGTDGRYVTREFRGGVECSIRAFGEDPAPRRKKRCEVELR